MEILILIIAGCIVVFVIRSVFRSGTKALEVGVHAANEYVESRLNGEKHEEAQRSAALKGLVVTLQNEVVTELLCDKEISQELPDRASIEKSAIEVFSVAYGVMESKGCCYSCRCPVYLFSSAVGDLLVLDSLDSPGRVHVCNSSDRTERVGLTHDNEEWQLFHLVGIGLHQIRGRFITDGIAGDIEVFKILERSGSGWVCRWNYEPVFISRIEDQQYSLKSVTLHLGHVVQLQLDIELSTPS